jgi:hypothetical protein
MIAGQGARAAAHAGGPAGGVCVPVCSATQPLPARLAA